MNDDDDENKPVLPTWDVGVLSGMRDVETYNRGRLLEESLRGCYNSPSLLSCETGFRKMLRQ